MPCAWRFPPFPFDTSRHLEGLCDRSAHCLCAIATSRSQVSARPPNPAMQKMLSCTSRACTVAAPLIGGPRKFSFTQASTIDFSSSRGEASNGWRTRANPFHLIRAFASVFDAKRVLCVTNTWI